MSEDEVCGHPRDGKPPCGSSIGLCEDCGKCISHCPHRAEERREARSLGGKAKAEKQRRRVQVLSDELPPLESHEAAQTWLDVVGRAVATDRIDTGPAQAAIRAVDTWIKVEAERIGSDALHELQERLETLESDVNGTVRGIG